MIRAVLTITMTALFVGAHAEPYMAAANDRLVLAGSQMVLPGYMIPDGMILCHSAAAAVRTDHAGCWRAQGGQRVEIIAALPTITQLRLWSTNGAEAVTAWAARVDADRIQQVAR